MDTAPATAMVLEGAMSDTPSQPASPLTVAVVGGGPAGLMAAQVLSEAGRKVTVYERMPTPGRKFLIAGRGGLNLTHSEPYERFVTRYGAASERLEPILEAFPPKDLIAWAKDLGQPTFIGSSGRIFPESLKASPLLRAWIARLREQGVDIRTRHDWTGWDASGALTFRLADGAVETVRPDATILALGGASWPKLGSDGGWTDILAARGVEVTQLRPSNVGFDVAWSDVFRDRFAGQPLKGLALRYAGHDVRGEAMITGYGLEGGAVYALSPVLREAIAVTGEAMLEIDLRPDLLKAQIAERLAKAGRGQTVANMLRKALHMTPASINLLREAHGVALPADPAALALAVKSSRLRLTGFQPLERAISSAGGVSFASLNAGLMLSAMPGVFVAGEMLDWEAPTGGYLLQACMATGVAAANLVLAYQA
jgi:uncharacterized flavoprotein (TIGR03862 family)